MALGAQTTKTSVVTSTSMCTVALANVKVLEPSTGCPPDRGTRSEVGLAHVRDEQALATARERYNRALGAPAHITANASAGPAQPFDSAVAVFVFSEEATETLIEDGWVAPEGRPIVHSPSPARR
jgi:hypothetical protein